MPRKPKEPWKLPLCGSEVFGGTGHIMDATGDIVLVAVVPRDGEPCAERLDARRERAIACINSAPAVAALADACRDSGDERIMAAREAYLKASGQ